MRTRFVFNAARAAAFASLGIWAGVLPVQVAIAGPLPSEHGIVAPLPGGGPQDQVLVFLTEFWDLAWGSEFLLNESGMGLEPTAVPGSWGVTAYEQNRQIGTGSYDEIMRLQVPGPWNDELPPGGLAVFDLSVTAGTFHGLGEYSTPTWGLVHHLEITGDGKEPLIVEGFTPLGTAEDLAIAVAGATDLLVTFTEWLALAAGGPPPFTPDPCHCMEIYDNDMSSCGATAVSCELLCTALALGGIAACLGAGPFVAPCVILVWAAHAVCVANCVAAYRACALRAASNFLRCTQLCPEKKIAH